MTTIVPSFSRSVVLRPITSFLVFSALIPFALGQTARDGSAPDAADETVVLSPFVVNNSKDVGYQAAATLSGSRTSVAMKDLANPVDVITKELIDDLGIKDIQDLTLFATGVEPNAVGDANTGGEEREVWNQNYMQIRGFKTGTATRNFMELQSVFDAYNSDRVEFSKGPNAILFGTGNPGGSSNYTTKVPSFARDFRTLQWGTDQEGTVRLTGDFNQVLVPNKLAVRFNVLHEEREFYRKPSYDDENAGHLVMTYQPFKSTTVTVGHEHRVVKRALPRGAFSIDTLSDYIAAGSPLVTAVPATGTSLQVNGVSPNVSAASVGLRIYGTSYYYDPVAKIARNTTRTATGANYSVNSSPTFTLDPEKIGFPRDRVVSGANGIADVEWEITEANVTQQFGENLSVDLAFAKSNSLKRIDNSLDSTVRMDPNSFGVNNRTGQYYVDLNPFLIDLDNEIVDFRATAAYKLDLTRFNRWLGKHQIGGLAERNEHDEVWDQMRLTLLSSPTGPNANLLSTASRFNLRYYLDPAKGVYSAPDFRDFVYSNGDISQDGYVAGFRRTTAFASKKDRTVQDSFLAVLHSEWWNGHLVTTLGVRKDNRDFRTAAFEDAVERRPVALVAGAPAGSSDPAYALLPSVPTLQATSISRNYGGVLHVTDWFGLSFNYSTNVSPSTESLGIFGQRVPFSSGQSRDYGLRFSLLNDRLSVSLLHYVTTEIGSIISGTTVNLPFTTLDAIEDILLENGVTTSNPLAAGSAWTTSDRQAKGEELLVVGEITPAWSVRLSATRNVNQLGNIAPEARAFFAEREPLYTKNSALLPLSGVGDSIGKRLLDAQTSFGLLKTREKVQQFPSSEYQARLTAKYTFGATQWRNLKGFSVGGNYRWASAPIIGYYKNANATFDVNRFYRGAEDRKIDLFFIYEPKLSKDLSWKIQLNIDNILDEKEPYAVGALNDSDSPAYKWVVYRMRPVDGRMVRLTNTINF